MDSANAVKFHEIIRRDFAHDLVKGVVPVVSNERGGAYVAAALTDGDYETFWATEDGVTTATLSSALTLLRQSTACRCRNTFRWDSV
mgnify:CR=1 FL=1